MGGRTGARKRSNRPTAPNFGLVTPRDTGWQKIPPAKRRAREQFFLRRRSDALHVPICIAGISFYKYLRCDRVRYLRAAHDLKLARQNSEIGFYKYPRCNQYRRCNRREHDPEKACPGLDPG
jgi:hypothetical protein